jgi:hypothetical protein
MDKSCKSCPYANRINCNKCRKDTTAHIQR